MCGADPGPGCEGRVCGTTCPRGFACNGSGSGCVVDPSSNWVVTATDGAVSRTTASGGSWDIDGSAPDPYLCLTINAVQRCTSYALNTFTPVWTDGLFPATRASNLMAGIPSAYSDDDVGPDDAICAAGPITFTSDNFAAAASGTPITFRCGAIGSFTVTLTPAP